MNKEKTSIASKIATMYRNDRHVWRLVIIMVLWLAFMAITKFSKFYTVSSFQTMFAQFPEYGLMALGVMVCMITGGIDLSTVGVANVTTIIMAILMRNMQNENGELTYGLILLFFVLSVIAGAIAGAFNGILVSKFKIPPILATLGSGQLFMGIGIVMTDGKAISDIPKSYAYAINNRMFGIPVQLIVFIIVAAVLAFMLTKTTYGIKLQMLGANQQVAEYSGLAVDRIIIKTYVISGICAALGGMIMLANYSSARADYGMNYTLQCILIVVLGGVSPSGGKGKISGVILAIILVRMLETGINRFPSVSSYYIALIWGAVLILVMVLDYFSDNQIKLFKRRKV